MAARYEVYKCEICGNIVEVLEGGKGQLVCCNQPMKMMEEQTADMATEKHVPIIKKHDDQVEVIVGSTIHPMIDKHYIMWIELVDENCGRIHRKYLKPGDEPKAHFHLCPGCEDHIYAREFCNIHNHWKGE